MQTVLDEGEAAAVLRVDGDMVDESGLEPDYPGIDEPITGAIGFTENEVHQAWQASARTWMASIELIGSCRSARAVRPAALSVQRLVDVDRHGVPSEAATASGARPRRAARR